MHSYYLFSSRKHFTHTYRWCSSGQLIMHNDSWPVLVRGWNKNVQPALLKRCCTDVIVFCHVRLFHPLYQYCTQFQIRSLTYLCFSYGIAEQDLEFSDVKLVRPSDGNTREHIPKWMTKSQDFSDRQQNRNPGSPIARHIMERKCEVGPTMI